MTLAIYSLFKTFEIIISQSKLQGTSPALKRQRASMQSQRAVQGRHSHLISLSQTVKSFLSQLYKNTSLQSGRALPWHCTTLKAFTQHSFIFTGSLCEKQELLLSTWTNWSSKRHVLAQGLAFKTAAKLALEARPPPGCQMCRPKAVARERWRTLPNAHLEDTIYKPYLIPYILKAVGFSLSFFISGQWGPKSLQLYSYFLILLHWFAQFISSIYSFSSY